jgi:hypothetical protein
VGDASNKIFYIDFDNVGDKNQIDIIPANPISPNSINPASTDFRKLGIGLVALKIKPKENSN